MGEEAKKNSHLPILKIKLGGGEEKIKKIHKNGKLTARERIDYLVDDQNDIIEIGSFVGYEMYEEFGGCPSGGVVTCIGYVKNRMCVIVANDCSVKAGAWFPITAKKNLRAQVHGIEKSQKMAICRTFLHLIY